MANQKKAEVSYDEHGVPIYSAQDLEKRAEEVLSFFDIEVLRIPRATPIPDIAQRLQDEFGVRIDLDADLGVMPTGEKILGRFISVPRSILVDSSLHPDTGRFNFTFAHEFGHFVLHRKLRLKGDYDPNEITDTQRDLVTGKKNLSTPRNWIEWQANRFASCILMPRLTVRNMVIEKQTELGITCNVGSVYLEDKSYSLRDFWVMLDHLATVYQVSRSTAEYRLADLGILIDKRYDDVEHVSEFLRAE